MAEKEIKNARIDKTKSKPRGKIDQMPEEFVDVPDNMPGDKKGK